MSDCYRCGGDGHPTADCTTPIPPPRRLSGTVRQPRAREADMHAWCDAIRQANGWEPRHHTKDTADDR